MHLAEVHTPIRQEKESTVHLHLENIIRALEKLAMSICAKIISEFAFSPEIALKKKRSGLIPSGLTSLGSEKSSTILNSFLLGR